ncbi:MAG: 5'/3'-nucleotidase SurE [Candidatus Schekmanbacteria bacterium]|nr:MAG: 5'/3'-nucleotidase SurE [Candidatus Schekmanbacteria bacterium]
MMALILICNDDGIEAKGLNTLYSELIKKFDVIVAAPDKERSASSHSLTIDRMPEYKKIKKNIYSIDGTPADCIYIALRKILDKKPDLVISGINHGANVAEDIFYSGTVSAALEAAMHNIPAIAVSVAEKSARFFEIAAKFSCKVAELLLTGKTLPNNTILNINVPNLPAELIEGVRITIQGRRNSSNSPFSSIMKDDKRALSGREAAQFTDYVALSNNMISITPLSTDLTNYSFVDELLEWDLKI